MAILTSKQKEKLLLLVKQAISKAQGRPELLNELDGIVKSLESDGIDPLNPEEIDQANEIIAEMQAVVEEYVNNIEVNDIESLEHAKKQLSINLMYLSTFKDRFSYTIEYLEDVFKKETFAKLATQISLKEGISFTQAEKKVNANDEYMKLRAEITTLKIKLGNFKTQYDFFSKMIQVIVQSISVAGKEFYSNKMTN